MVSDISGITRGKKGLAILTGMIEKGSPYGTRVDLDNMNKAFETLGFAVKRMENISRFDLVAVTKAAKKSTTKKGHHLLMSLSFTLLVTGTLLMIEDL